MTLAAKTVATIETSASPPGRDRELCWNQRRNQARKRPRARVDFYSFGSVLIVSRKFLPVGLSEYSADSTARWKSVSSDWNFHWPSTDRDTISCAHISRSWDPSSSVRPLCPNFGASSNPWVPAISSCSARCHALSRNLSRPVWKLPSKLISLCAAASILFCESKKVQNFN